MPSMSAICVSPWSTVTSTICARRSSRRAAPHLYSNQVIYDIEVSGMAFGHICLIGDAASPSVMTCWPAAAPSAAALNSLARSAPVTRASSSGSTPLATRPVVCAEVDPHSQSSMAW